MNVKQNWNGRLFKSSIAIVASALLFTTPMTVSLAADTPADTAVVVLLLDPTGQVTGMTFALIDSTGLVVDAVTGVPIGTTTFTEPIVIGFDSTPVGVIEE